MFRRNLITTIAAAALAAAVPVLTTADADQAGRTRRFLRLADRMLEDMHGLHFASEEPNES